MRLSRALPVLLLLLLLVPAAQAAINGPRAYRADYDYMPELDAPEFTMVSGRMEADMPSAGGSFGFINTNGAQLSGLSRVCWGTGIARQCRDSLAGNLRIIVLDEGSFGLKLPDGVEARVTGDHAIAMFADLAGEANLNSLDLGESLLAPLVGGVVTLGSIPSVPTSSLPTPISTGNAAFTLIDDASTAEIRDGSTLQGTIAGKGDPVTFAGNPVLTPVETNMAVIPFLGPTDVARFEPAAHADAVRGLEIARINALMDRLYNANEGQPTNSVPIDANAFGPYSDAVGRLFAGAVLRVPTRQTTGNDIAFARVTSLQVSGLPGGELAWSGRATLEVREGHVVGAKDLAGAGFLQLPWWSWVLWFVAIGLFVTRLVLKTPKKNERWDRYKWIGWVASPLAFILVFVLWDFEVRAILGLSLFSGASGQVLLLVGALQVGTLLAASFAAMAPLRMALRNGSILLKQGTFMGLAGAAASLLGFLFIVAYLRSYLDVIISNVLAGIQ